MRLNFDSLRQMGFHVQVDDEGIEIIPEQENSTLAGKMHKTLKILNNFTDVECDIVIEAAMAAQNRILICKAIS